MTDTAAPTPSPASVDPGESTGQGGATQGPDAAAYQRLLTENEAMTSMQRATADLLDAYNASPVRARAGVTAISDYLDAVYRIYYGTDGEALVYSEHQEWQSLASTVAETVDEENVFHYIYSKAKDVCDSWLFHLQDQFASANPVPISEWDQARTDTQDLINLLFSQRGDLQ